MALPFVLLPLLAITASKHWMSAEILPPAPAESEGEGEGECSLREEHQLQSTTEAHPESTASSSPPAASVAVERGQRWHFEPRLLLHWSWWTRGAGKVVEEKWPSSPTATRGTDSLDERAATSARHLRPIPGLASQTKLSTHFANGWVIVAITSAIYVIIVISDVYVIITTALGTGGS